MSKTIGQKRKFTSIADFDAACFPQRTKELKMERSRDPRALASDLARRSLEGAVMLLRTR